jgi:hypothetical protein
MTPGEPFSPEMITKMTGNRFGAEVRPPSF